MFHHHRSSVLSSAAEGRHVQIIEELFTAGVDVNLAPVEIDEMPWTTLCLVTARNGDLDALEKLLEAGADVNTNVPTAIQVAADSEHHIIFEKLVVTGPDPSNVVYEHRQYDQQEAN